MKTLNVIFLLALACALAGCGMFGSTPPPEPEKTGPVVDFMISHQSGDSGTVDDADFGENIRIVMQDSFNSAKGEVCKRATLTAEQRQTEMVVICRQGDAPWKLAPRIWGQGIE